MQPFTSKSTAVSALHVGSPSIRKDGPEPARDCPHAFLEGIARWPSLNLAFYDRSLHILAREGEAAWTAQGGKLAVRTNLPTFSNPSPVAAAIVTEIAAQFEGFNFTDDAGRPWSVRLDKTNSDHRYWTGTAIGGEALLFLLSGLGREKYAAELRSLFAKRNMFQRSGSPEDWQIWKDIFALVKRIRLLDGAPRMLPVLYDAAVANGAGEILIKIDVLAKALYNPKRARRPFDWKLDTHDALKLLSKIRVRRLKLPRTGWCFQQFSEASVVPYVGWNRDSFRIKMDPDFLEFLRPCFSSEGFDVTHNPNRQSSPISFSTTNHDQKNRIHITV